MVVGMLISAICGGVTAAGLSVGADHSLGHMMVSYPLGGLLAVLSFLAAALAWQGISASTRR